MDIWLIWFIVAAIFIVGEIFTAGFFILWFGVAALVAGLLALLGFGSLWQWLAFAVCSGVLVMISRRLADKITHEQPPGIGANRAIGRIVLVLEEIDNDKGSGLVRLDKEIWKALSAPGEVLKEGMRATVIRVDGVHLVVEPIKEEN